MLKRSFKTAVVLIMLALITVPALGSECMAAKGKVVKVTKKYCQVNSNKYYDTFYGKTKSGNVVWAYKSKKYRPAQCDSTAHKVKGNYVYINNCGFMRKLKLQSGKVVKKAKQKITVMGGIIDADKKGNVAVSAPLGTEVYGLNSKLNVKWKRNVKVSEIAWEPAKISITNGNVYVQYSTISEDGRYEKHAIKFSNGKQLY